MHETSHIGQDSTADDFPRRWTVSSRELTAPVAGFIEVYGHQDSTGVAVGLVAVEAVGDSLTAGQARALARVLMAAAEDAERLGPTR